MYGEFKIDEVLKLIKNETKKIIKSKKKSISFLKQLKVNSYNKYNKE